MKRSEVIDTIKELEIDLVDAQEYDKFYQELLDEYAVNIWALKSIGDMWPMEHAIELSERHQELAGMFNGFKEYIRLTDMLDIIWTEIPEERKVNDC